jgi:hypothetical protein
VPHSCPVVGQIEWDTTTASKDAVRHEEPTRFAKGASLNVPVMIVGVSSGRFAGLQMGSAQQIFVSLTMQPLVLPRAQNVSVSFLDNPQSWWVQVLVRLRPGVSEARSSQAQRWCCCASRC